MVFNMLGEVEVYKITQTGNELIAKESNLIVDGASEVLVDMFTTPPGLANIAELSSILDTSNFTVQAISFGTDWLGLSGNAHRPTRPLTGYGNVISWYINAGEPYIVGYVMDGTNWALSGDLQNEMPSVPRPTDRKLEETVRERERRNIEEFVYGRGDVTFPYTSGVADTATKMAINHVGQHINALEFSAHFGCTELSSAMARGSFGPALGPATLVLSTVGVGVLSEPAHISPYNTNETMDAEGFVKLDSAETDPYGTLILSAEATASSTGEVMYITQMGAHDLNMLYHYGGLYSLGLWTVDIKENQRLGRTVPLTFNRSGDLRKHKLFSKKVFVSDLSYSDSYLGTVGSAADRLLIIWRMKFHDS